MVSESGESNHWFVYIIECKNKTLYTGITNNIERRIKEHNFGKGGHYTKIHIPVELLWKEMHPNRPSALQRESQIKHWTRKKKEALVKGDFELLKKL
jgi:predicted GIY-YIG superfamily endonuclease